MAFKKNLKIWDIVVIVTNLWVLTWYFQTQVFWVHLWNEVRKKNDKEGGVRRGKTESAHCPTWTFSFFQGERVGCTFLVFWSYLLWIGTQIYPWASETYIALKEATGIYSTQTKFNGLIFSSWINKVIA